MELPAQKKCRPSKSCSQGNSSDTMLLVEQAYRSTRVNKHLSSLIDKTETTH